MKGKNKGNKRMGRKLDNKEKEETVRKALKDAQNSQPQPQTPFNNNPISSYSPNDKVPAALERRETNYRGKEEEDFRLQQGTSHDSIHHQNYHENDIDHQQSIQQTTTNSVVINSPRDRRPTGLFGGATGDVVIKGGTLNNTHGHQTNPPLASHEENYDASSPQLLLSPLSVPSQTPNHDPTPSHTQNIPQVHNSPMPVWDQRPSLPIPNIASPLAQDIHQRYKSKQSSSTSIATYSPENGHKIYERHLGLKQRGFPLWIPEPNRTLPLPYRRRGVSIGDVGIITPSGGFSFLFNICLPHNDPINPPTLPDGFVPIDPPIHSTDIFESLEFKPGSYLASTPIEETHDPSFCVQTFSTSSAEGALLTLPDGAIARDLENVRRFREYAEANIESWYRYVNGPRGREAKNGEVRLVTGCDKATSWGIAALADLTQQQKTHCLRYRSVDDERAATSPIPLYKWEHTGLAEARVGPVLQEIEDLGKNDNSDQAVGGKYWNQCLFVRTLNITLSDEAFAKISQDVVSAPQQFQTRDGFSASIDNSLHPETQMGTSGQTPGTTFVAQIESESLGSGSESRGNSSIVKECTTIPRSPVTPISHPADTLNKLLLQKFPTSRIVITEDEDWCSVLREDDETMSNSSEIAKRVLDFHRIKEDHGVLHLEPNTERPSPPRRRQTASTQSVKNHTDSPELSGSISFASLDSCTMRSPTLDMPNWLPVNHSAPILLDEGDLLKDMNTEDIVIAVMGPSGTGKSSFINTLFGSEVAQISGGLQSCTQNVHAFGCFHPNRSNQRIIVVDTPGFDDTHRTDYDILKDIADWLETTYSKRIKLSGLLHFHNIQDARMRRTPQRNLGMFQQLCGPDALKNVILLTTFWDELDEHEQKHVGPFREKQLKELFWTPLIDKGSRVDRFDPPTYERAWKIVDQFPPATATPLAIQIELVDEHKKLWETSVFKFLVHWWTQVVNAIRGSKKNPSKTDPDPFRQKSALERSMPDSASSRLSIRSTSSPTEFTSKWFRERRK